MSEWKDYNKEYLKHLIKDCVEESLNLDYKAADALGKSESKKSEIAKDVSAMANSAGGIVIYGLKEYDEEEKKHLPEKITPIIRKDFSKEWLEHIINSNISPKIDSLIIHPIALDQPNEVAYIVEIPQSNTAHQNTKDFRYYRRYNFESVPMLDYEIKDIMNRNKNPIIDLNFEIIEKIIEVENNFFQNPVFPTLPTKNYKKRITLKISPVNVGSIFANYVNYFVFVPNDLLKDKDMKTKNGFAEYYGENVHRDIIGFTPGIGNYVGNPKYGSSRFDPILPGTRGIFKIISLVENPLLDEREISWRVHSDNANPKEGSMKLCDIKYSKTERT